ncbi:hypothetical protein [Lacticaseibacillus salsurivasis]|uniref:hypothetical protein n=1 Tax=Lacticaseibacillus salsurivasis TaxID=3081441 RepID=UPI0030C6CEE9
MKYRNRKTGVIITSASAISGGDWEPFLANPKPQQTKPQQTKQAPAVKQSAPVAAPAKPVASSVGEGIDGVTVKQIKQELDAMGIKYTATAKKQELYDLMMGK